MFSKNARSRDGLAFYCREHLAERSARTREARRAKPRVQRRRPAGLVVAEGQKWCPDCATVRSLDEFVRTAASTSGYGSYCKPCHNARGKRALEKVGGARTYHLTRRYGITAAEAEHMLRQQNGVCAICRTAPAAHVDHDHSTGKVRALLCFNCNGGLGQFRDDPAALQAAVFYVEHHNQQQAIAYLVEASAGEPEAASRPGEPPVGSQRRPSAPGTSTRSTGRTSGARRREQAGEADT
ncbi:endonuclease VII domain-containing protein [Blastococcus goldschmidtiae]|uniref:Endonuclease VII domain-containing protein n=1 Tax=Blastococcus goldschmidtiae TaxID=3075546 RepID=A0ABU2KA10_9ACTN|nr:endonuclease VII domain-containing protein [Blastococcus sp. DSM 46792]MDT0277031.1 endonuclease VII domain-containing protein [Blastococcus sp. DSM 46792]